MHQERPIWIFNVEGKIAKWLVQRVFVIMYCIP